VSDFDFDVAVIGLGPAGSILARLLSDRLRVVAIDRKHGGADSFRKPCGGLLAPDAQKILAGINLALPKTVLTDPQIFSVKTLDSRADLLRYYQRFYINIDRHKFDMWLISLIPERVTLKQNSVVTRVSAEKGGYRVTYSQNGETTAVAARYVVGADGSNSVVRQCLFPERTIARYLSIQERFAEEHMTPFYSCVFDRRVTDSYCWSLSKDGSFILGGAFRPKTANADFDELKRILSEKGFLFGDPIRREACLVSMPRRGADLFTGARGAFLVGEAAGFISPSSLEGISYALRSGQALAKALNSGGAPDARYRRAAASVKRKLRLKMLKRPFMYSPLLRGAVMALGINSIQVTE
jgi:flavin-dependent dehydrogenase